MKLFPEIDDNSGIIPDHIQKDPPYLMLPSFTKIFAVYTVKEGASTQITE